MAKKKNYFSHNFFPNKKNVNFKILKKKVIQKVVEKNYAKSSFFILPFTKFFAKLCVF
jgi:hypothetical protein